MYAPAVQLARAGVVAGHDMTTEAAMTKLMYLLANGADSRKVAEEMSTPLRGELTEHSRMVFRHPGGVLPQGVANLTAVGYAIREGDLKKVKEILKGEPEWLLNEPDYLGNTPLVSKANSVLKPANRGNQHLAATGPNLQILRHFLSEGASVHLRNRTGRTPLFLAANAGLTEHVLLLRQSGAHLHSSEWSVAELHSQQRPEVWKLAGIGSLRRYSTNERRE